MSAAIIKKDDGLMPDGSEQNKSHQEKLLVIDDSPEVLGIIKAVFKRNFLIETLTKVDSIIKTIETVKPNIILMDIHMPNVDGFELISQVNRHPLFDDIPIIIMSGDASEANRNRADELGTVGFIQKPFEIKSLAAQFDGILNGLNSSVNSLSGKKTWHNIFSTREKKKILNSYVRKAANNEKRTVILTWEDPLNFLETDLTVYLRSNHFSFMQFKPSLIPRFPFLHGFAGLVEELAYIAKMGAGNTDIVIDEPMTLFRNNEEEVSHSQIIQFFREIEFRANKITVLNVRNKDKKIETFSHKLAKDFIG
jgi:DNA-binding response OmpR family regulator